jgi:hypothetical protein
MNRRRVNVFLFIVFAPSFARAASGQESKRQIRHSQPSNPTKAAALRLAACTRYPLYANQFARQRRWMSGGLPRHADNDALALAPMKLIGASPVYSTCAT